MWIVVVVILAVVAGSVCTYAAVKGKSVRGSGNLVTKTVTVGNFDAIEASRAVKVVVAERPQGEVLVEADDNLIDYVKVVVEDGDLKVGFDKQIGNTSNIHVTVTVPFAAGLRSLEASSAASIVCPMPLIAGRVELDASSAARIEAVVQAETCDVSASSASRITADVVAKACNAELSSAANIELKGKAMTCNAELSSASRLDAGEFIVGEYSIDASSAAKANVNCIAKLDADVSSGARVNYKGDCGGVRNISSGGSVVKQ